MINKCINYKFFKGFTNHRNKVNMVVVVSHLPFPNIPGATDETFKHILSSSSPYFKTTTGMQSIQDVIAESRFVITFLTNLGVLQLLCILN